MKTLNFVFLLLLSCLTACITVTPSDRFLAARHQTYFVSTAVSSGTGVLVNDKCVLTVDHVVNNMDVLAVMDDSEHYTQAKPVAEDAKMDLAVVCADKPLAGKPAHLAKQMPEQYAEVFTIGYPLKVSLMLTTGRYELNGIVSASGAPGNSGGGVFDNNGDVIGLVDTVALYGSPVGVLTFAHIVGIVESPDIREWLDANHITYQD